MPGASGWLWITWRLTRLRVGARSKGHAGLGLESRSWWRPICNPQLKIALSILRGYLPWRDLKQNGIVFNRGVFSNIGVSIWVSLSYHSSEVSLSLFVIGGLEPDWDSGFRRSGLPWRSQVERSRFPKCHPAGSSTRRFACVFRHGLLSGSSYDKVLRTCFSGSFVNRGAVCSTRPGIRPPMPSAKQSKDKFLSPRCV